jgi:hypothetical protein
VGTGGVAKKLASLQGLKESDSRRTNTMLEGRHEGFLKWRSLFRGL